MKRILSVLLALVMIVGMIPMSILSASAAETEVVFELGADGTASHSDGSSKTSYSETNGSYTLDLTDVSNFYTGARDATGKSCIKLGTSSKTGGFSFTVPGDVTSVVINVAGYKAKTVTVDINGTSQTISTLSNNGEYTAITINTITTKTITLTTSTNYRAMVNSVTFICGSGTETTCDHANTSNVEAVAATCTADGFTAGVYCNDCESYIEGHETVAALGHSNDEGVVTAATCTTDGYTLYTCTVCGSTGKSDWVDATGHNYVDGVCSACGIAKPAGLDGKYYIAAIRSSGNYQYMTNDLGTASTKRYQIVDSGLTTLPTSIETVVDAQVFELVASGDGYKIKTGDQYLGYTSGNSGTLVVEADARVVTIENGAEGAYVIHFTAAADDERYLALNSNSTSPYFAWYKGAGNQIQDLYLIPVVESTTDPEDPTDPTEPTDPEQPAGEHDSCDVQIIEAKDPTCTEPGNTAGKYCNDCDEYFDGYEVIEATGHNYVNGTCSVCGEAESGTPAETTATITFDDTSKRTTLTTTQQVWTENGVTVTNDKASSTTNIADYSNPARFYKGSTVTVAYTGMTKIVFNCNTAGYATALSNSISNATVSVSDKVVTVVLDAAADTFTTEGMSAQVRVDSITVTASTCEHVWSEMVQTSAPTCTETGVNTSTCTLCGETKTETVPATGHTYTYVDGSMTCACGDVAAISTIAEAKAYTSTSKVYYIKGIVTYVSGKNVYIEDATGAICVYFATAPSDIALGDEIVVWDTMTAYNGLIETTNTTAQEYLKVSSGNALPSQTVTIADLTADTTKEYLGERVVIEGVTVGTINTSGNTALTDENGNTINIYKVSGLAENINENDTVTVTAIVSTYNGYQLLINPGTAATDVVETAAGEEEVVTTVTIAEAKAGTAGEYYQVEGVVTFIDGRNVYIQDSTGGIVVYLTATNTTAAIGDKIKAYGQLKLYNGLIELDGIDQTNTDQFEVLSNDNVVEAQAITIADLKADATNEYLAEKITLSGVYVSYVNYSSSYGNFTYKLYDSNGNFIEIFRMTVASEEEVVAVGSQINVEAIVSSYNGYQLVTSSDKITVTGTCAHETTQLVNYVAATCTEAGYSGDTMCTTCGYYTVKGAATEALGHSFTENGTCANDCGTPAVIVMNGEYYTSFDDANAAYDGHPMKLLANIGENGPVTLTKTVYVDLNSFNMYAVSSTANCTVFGMDSSTDSYEAEKWGTLSVDGAAVAPVTNNSYLAVSEGENEWSFHAFSVQVTHVSLDPSNDAFGYKAQFFGDEVVQSYVTGFGFNLWINEDRVVTRGFDQAFTNGQTLTLRLKGIMAGNGGTTPIYAEAFVKFSNNDSGAKSTTHEKTMKDAIEVIETNLENGATAYTPDQMEALQAWIALYEDKMNGWNIDTIKAWMAQ